jgi:purine-binding chemotaxis protein CheW
MDEDSLEKQPAIGPEGLALEGNRAVVFEVSGYSCGLPLEQVREIVPMCDLARPPGLPPLLEGLLNLRGEITPVVRLDRLFGVPPIVLRRHTQLVVLQGPAPLALLADRVRNVAVVVPAELLPASGDSVFNDCLAGVLPAAQGPIHFLHAERLLLAQEKQRIAELQEIAQRRLAELEGVGQ